VIQDLLQQELNTERLFLRQVRDEDAHDLFRLHSDPVQARYLSRLPMSDPDEAVARIAMLRDQRRQGTGVEWMMLPRGVEKPSVIGAISLFKLDEQSLRAEIGFLLAADYWQKGLMAEAARAVIAFAFARLGRQRIEAETDPRNTACCRLLEKLGFSLEGTLRRRWRVGDEWSDSAMYGLLLSDGKHHPGGSRS
jgi:ribosomal-protein-alanine N-acetyltransferase